MRMRVHLFRDKKKKKNLPKETSSPTMAVILIVIIREVKTSLVSFIRSEDRPKN